MGNRRRCGGNNKWQRCVVGSQGVHSVITCCACEGGLGCNYFVAVDGNVWGFLVGQ